jgi:hypothetical protein
MNKTNIELVIEKGIPKRKDLQYYPYWSLKITDRSGKNEVTITPKFNQIEKLLREILTHEKQVDYITNRNSEFSKWRTFLTTILLEIEQEEIFETEIPEVIKNCKRAIK